MQSVVETLNAVFGEEIDVNGDCLRLAMAASDGAPLATVVATLQTDDDVSATFVSLSLLDRKLRALQPALEAAARDALSATSDALAALMDAQTRCRQVVDDARAVDAAAASGGDAAGAAAASAAAPATTTVTTLLRLDHMRDAAGYTSFIVDTVTGLGLSGGLYTCGRLILIVLVGASGRVAEYLRLARTSTVDVDSAGRRCKEK